MCPYSFMRDFFGNISQYSPVTNDWNSFWWIYPCSNCLITIFVMPLPLTIKINYIWHAKKYLRNEIRSQITRTERFSWIANASRISASIWSRAIFNESIVTVISCSFPFSLCIWMCLCIISRWFHKRFTKAIIEKCVLFSFHLVYNTESITKAKMIVKTIEYFENANFSLFFLPLIVFLHQFQPNTRNCRENILNKGIANKSQQTVCHRTSSTRARIISQMWFRYAVNCVATAVSAAAAATDVCIYWITYLQMSFRLDFYCCHESALLPCTKRHTACIWKH